MAELAYIIVAALLAIAIGWHLWWRKRCPTCGKKFKADYCRECDLTQRAGYGEDD